MASAEEKLRTYRQKRDFQVTPEPPPEAEPRKAVQGPLFMVHKHDASRLHYDLRLELDGVLASWAIPKGPSYDPEAKRLAVQTEDHPLEYGNFEGRIPDGEYGAGDSIIWDRGTYETVPPGQTAAQREKGHLHLRLSGEKLNGTWHLVRTRPLGGKAQWILFKARDGTENPAYDVVAERPESVVSGRRVTRGPVTMKTLRAPHPLPDVLLQRVWPPMRATLSRPERAPAADFRYEVKYDGYRALAAVSGGKVAVVTRNALDLAGRFPKVARALERLGVGEAVIDGEVAALDKDGRSRFALLMEPGFEERYFAFDLLWLDGEDLRRRPLEERRELLQSVLSNVPPPLALSEEVRAGTVAEAMEAARRAGWEGLLAKRRGSPYTPGKSSGDWLKLKLSQAQELAVAGYVPLKPKTEKRKAGAAVEIGALLVAVWDGAKFVFAGKVGTGYSEAMRRKLRRLLDQDRTEVPQVEGAPRMRDAVWVRPRLVAQVGFTEWTAEGKLRHPTFLGLREDKAPQEAVRERPEGGGRGAPPPPRPRHAAPAAEEVQLTSGSRVLFPEAGYTKQDVFEYYRAVAPVMVPAMAGRPIAFQQWPQGIHKPGFFRQQARGVPPWATTVEIQHADRPLPHLVVDRPETLLWLANQSALTLHVWNGRVPHLSEPDWVVFDLDPDKGGDPRKSWEALVTVARALHGFLEQLNLFSVPKTSGSRGLHVLVPLARGHTQEDALELAVAITSTLERGLPDLATTERTVRARGGRLYLDAFQNGMGKTLVAPYAVRNTPAASVSTPLRWAEVTPSLDPAAFTIKTLPARIQQVGDLFAPALEGRQRLPRFK